jgi:murein DD-endopeptidase MepM/ murein hydrolase activator NlpD
MALFHIADLPAHGKGHRFGGKSMKRPGHLLAAMLLAIGGGAAVAAGPTQAQPGKQSAMEYPEGTAAACSPSAPGTVRVVRRTATTLTVSWSTGGSCGYGTARFNIRLNGAHAFSVDGARQRATITGLRPGRSYRVGVQLRTENGRRSGVTVKRYRTKLVQPPRTIRSAGRTDRKVLVRWDRAVARGGVRQYVIKVNGRTDRRVPASKRSTWLTGLSPDTRYRISVQARSSGGVYSGRTMVTVRTERVLWVHPLPGASISFGYGSESDGSHAGVDLVRPHRTPVRSVAAGTVVAAGWHRTGYGISVLVRHSNGRYTHYAHLDSASVGVGQAVGAGQVVGRQGSTGDATGSHLHFEVHNGLWRHINPVTFMRGKGVFI